MALLYVWLDGTARSVTDNISTGDIMGVKMGTLKIFKFYDNVVYRLNVVDEKLSWAEVAEANEVRSSEVKFHVP